MRKVVSAVADHTRDPLERRLRSLTDRDDLFPATPDIAGALFDLVRMEAPRSDRRGFPPAWRVAAIVLLVALGLLVAALAIPTSRTAIADFFGIEGIRIELGGDEETAVPGTPVSIGGALLLGEQTTFDEAARAAPFEVAVPAGAGVGEPDEVYLNQRSGVTVVGMLWRAAEGLPEIGSTGVGLLLLEIESHDDDVIFAKRMAGGGGFTIVTINGRQGYWIERGVLAVEPIDGLMLDPLEPEVRRSGNVLIWSDGSITYRLETALPMRDAVRIAESLAPTVMAPPN